MSEEIPKRLNPPYGEIVSEPILKKFTCIQRITGNEVRAKMEAIRRRGIAGILQKSTARVAIPMGKNDGLRSDIAAVVKPHETNLGVEGCRNVEQIRL